MRLFSSPAFIEAVVGIKLAYCLMLRCTLCITSEDRSAKRAKTDHGKHQSANGGDAIQSSATVVTQQQVIQSTAPADVMPAYTYTPTWPGYAVRLSHYIHVVFMSIEGIFQPKVTDNKAIEINSQFNH